VSKIELYIRPLVVFDAANREHRQYFFNFLRTGGWKGCPYRWALEDDHGFLIGQMQRAVNEYYLARDFKNVAKAPQTLVRQKRKKTVDK
jgi:hypothetical protein